jgi:hypothetical protein
MDFVTYRGYFIHLGGRSQSWRFMAAPAATDLPILSRGTSSDFPSRDAALTEAQRQIDRLFAL